MSSAKRPTKTYGRKGSTNVSSNNSLNNGSSTSSIQRHQLRFESHEDGGSHGSSHSLSAMDPNIKRNLSSSYKRGRDESVDSDSSEEDSNRSELHSDATVRKSGDKAKAKPLTVHYKQLQAAGRPIEDGTGDFRGERKVNPVESLQTSDRGNVEVSSNVERKSIMDALPNGNGSSSIMNGKLEILGSDSIEGAEALAGLSHCKRPLNSTRKKGRDLEAKMPSPRSKKRQQTAATGQPTSPDKSPFSAISRSPSLVSPLQTKDRKPPLTPLPTTPVQSKSKSSPSKGILNSPKTFFAGPSSPTPKPPALARNGAGSKSPHPSTPVSRSPAKDLSQVFAMFVPHLSDSITENQNKNHNESGNLPASPGKEDTTMNKVITRMGLKRESPSTSRVVTGQLSPPGTTLPRESVSDLFTPSTESVLSSSPRAHNTALPLPSAATGNNASGGTTPHPQSPRRSLSPSKYPRQVVKPHSSVSNATVMPASMNGIPGNTHKRTYGGKRSFRRDIEAEEMFGGSGDCHTRTLGMSLTENEIIDEESNLGRDKDTSAPSPLPALDDNSRFNYLSSRPSQLVRQRDTYASLLTRWGAEEEENLEDTQEGNSELKSITQLRAKGENSRFVDEFDYLVEGLDSTFPLTVRRASTLEVLKKILNPEFIRRLKASGYVERIYLQFRKAEAGDGDRVLDTALAVLIAIMVRDQRIAEPLLRVQASQLSGGDGSEEVTCDVLEVLVKLLHRPWVEHMSDGKLSKSELRMIETISNIVEEAQLLAMFHLPTCVRSLAIISINSIASLLPRVGLQPQYLLSSSNALEATIHSFIQEAAHLTSRFIKFEKGLDLLPAGCPVNLSSLTLQLDTLGACLSVCPLITYPVLEEYQTDLAVTLGNLARASYLIILHPSSGPEPTDGDTKRHGEESETASASGKLRTAENALLLSLKMMVDFTTMTTKWAAVFGGISSSTTLMIKLISWTRTDEHASERRTKTAAETLDMVPSSPLNTDKSGAGSAPAGANAEPTFKFDVLCLALGVLTNLVESVDVVQDIILNMPLSKNCKHERRCLSQCQCISGNSETALDLLIDLYLDPLEDSANDMNTAFVNGYTGILVGLCVIDLPEELQRSLLHKLREDVIAFERWCGALEEFASVQDSDMDATATRKRIMEDEVEGLGSQRSSAAAIEVDCEESLRENVVKDRPNRLWMGDKIRKMTRALKFVQ